MNFMRPLLTRKQLNLQTVSMKEVIRGLSSLSTTTRLLKIRGIQECKPARGGLKDFYYRIELRILSLLLPI